jgi:hypothetical protein
VSRTITINACAHGAHLIIRSIVYCQSHCPTLLCPLLCDATARRTSEQLRFSSRRGSGETPPAAHLPTYFWDPSIVGCCGGAGARCDDELCCACDWPEFLIVQSKLWSYA